MKNSKQIFFISSVLLLASLFIAPSSYADVDNGGASGGCNTITDCFAQDYYMGACNVHIEDPMVDCPVNGWDVRTFSCSTGCGGTCSAGRIRCGSACIDPYVDDGTCSGAGLGFNQCTGACTGCTGGKISVLGTCLKPLQIVDDDAPVSGEEAYKIWDGTAVTEVVHLNTAGCADDEMPVADSASPTGWSCTAITGGLWSENGANIYYDGGDVGIGTNTPAYELDVDGEVNSIALCIQDDCRSSWPLNTDLWEENWGHVYRPTGNVAIGLATTTTPGGVLQVATNEPVEINNCTSSFLIGTCTGAHVEMDTNSLQAKGTNTTVATLNLQELGGNLQVDGSTLVVDSTNNRVGIGDSNPDYMLDVTGSFSVGIDALDAKFFVDSANGRVGVNTGNPDYSLDVDGTLRVGSEANSTSVLYVGTRVGINTNTPSSPYELDVAGQANADELCINGTCKSAWPAAGLWTASGSNVYRNSGNVGIGVTNPAADLHVDDTIRVGYDPSYSVYGELIHTGGGNGFKINAEAGGGSWGDLYLQTNGNTRLFIESAGKVGIGTTSPDAKLDVEGDVRLHNIYSQDSATFNITSSDNYFIDLESNDDTYGLIIRESTVQNGDATADYLNIEPKDTYTSFGASTSGEDLKLYEDGKLEIVNGPENTGSTASLVVDDGDQTSYYDGNEIASSDNLYIQHHNIRNTYFDGGGNVVINGNHNSSGYSSAYKLQVYGSVSLHGNSLYGVNSATFNDNLNVGGWVDIGDDLDVGGAAVIDGNLATYGALTSWGNFATIGEATFSNSVDVADNVYVDDLVRIYMDTSHLANYWTIEVNNPYSDLVFTPHNSSDYRWWVSNDTGHLSAKGYDIWSDGRDKNVRGDYLDGLNIIEQLRPVEFTWKVDDETKENSSLQIGLIAQEVQKVLPEAVHVSQGEDGTMSIDYAVVSTALVNAVKELKTENDALKSVVCELKPTAEICNK